MQVITEKHIDLDQDEVAVVFRNDGQLVGYTSDPNGVGRDGGDDPGPEIVNLILVAALFRPGFEDLRNAIGRRVGLQIEQIAKHGEREREKPK
jgi:hypothetical protein